MSGPLLQQATALHGAGRVAEAIVLYRRVVLTDPRNARAQYLLAAASLATGDPAAALASVDRALALDPRSPDHHAVRGHALKAAGRLDEAIGCYREAVRLKPSYAEMQFNLANALRQRAVDADDVAGLEEAAESYRRAVRLKPDLAGAHNNLGATLRALKRPGEAAESFHRALRLTPRSGELIGNLGSALLEDGQHAAAADMLTRAVSLAPTSALWTQLGLARHRLKLWNDAAAAYTEALRLSPGDIAILGERSTSLVLARRFAEARADLDTALAAAPERPDLWNNLGFLLLQTGHDAEAEAAFERALTLEPGRSDASYGLSTSLLRRGAYGERAWDMLEHRWGVHVTRQRRPGPHWMGEAMGDRTLVIDPEQGAGDIIMFSRYAALAAKRARVMLVAPPYLTRLMASLDGPAEVVSEADPPPPFDAHIPLFSLPRAFDTTLATIPSSPAYLSADPHAVAAWRARLSLVPGLRVGLVWRGSPDFSVTHWRDLPVAALAPLGALPGISFVSLQKPRDPAAPAWIAADWTDELQDYADTAALVAALDLVIGCDTGVLHLAGALGKPCWILHRANTDWRWYPKVPTTPWYPSMRQFWQPELGEWDSVIAEVAQALAALSEKREPA